MELPTDNNLYFACIDLTDRHVVVVGAGPVALEKLAGLRAAGARIRVIAPEAHPEIRELARNADIEWKDRPYEADDLDGAFLAVVATGDDRVAQQVHDDAEARRMLVNVADVPELCNFILPAIVREGPIAVAISTAGASPALAQRLRDEIGRLLKRPYPALARLLQSLRPWAKTSLPDYDTRKRFFDRIVNGDPDPLTLLERDDRADLQRVIDEAKQEASPRA